MKLHWATRMLIAGAILFVVAYLLLLVSLVLGTLYGLQSDPEVAKAVPWGPLLLATASDLIRSLLPVLLFIAAAVGIEWIRALQRPEPDRLSTDAFASPFDRVQRFLRGGGWIPALVGLAAVVTAANEVFFAVRGLWRQDELSADLVLLFLGQALNGLSDAFMLAALAAALHMLRRIRVRRAADATERAE